MVDPSSASAPAPPDGAGRSGSWEIEDVYDPDTLAQIDRAAGVAAERAEEVRRGRSGMAGMLMAGVMVGVADVLDPDRIQPEMVEFTPDHPDPESMPVQFVYVPGDPSASRLIIRRWLFGQ
jgi:hypothetical protein